MAPRLHAYPFTPADARATAFDRPACRLAAGPRRTARGRHGLSVALLVAVTLTGTMLPATAAAGTGATSASATTLHDTAVFTEFHENADSMPSTPSVPAWSLTASASGWRNGVGFGVAVSRFNRLDPVVCWWRDCPPPRLRNGPNGPVIRARSGLPPPVVPSSHPPVGAKPRARARREDARRLSGSEEPPTLYSPEAAGSTTRSMVKRR